MNRKPWKPKPHPPNNNQPRKYHARLCLDYYWLLLCFVHSRYLLSLLLKRPVTFWSKLLFLASFTLYARILMWSLPWTPWASWSSQDKEPEEVKKQTKAGEGQRSQRGVKYYQRSRSEEKSADIDETAGMDKRKLKPPGGAKRAAGNQQQGDGAELDDGWQVVQEEELQALTNAKVEIILFWDTSQMYLFQCVFRDPWI